MDGSKSDDRDGGGKEKKPPRAPRSVREGLGAEESRGRHGRKGQRGRPGRERGAGGRPPRAGPPPVDPPGGARIARQAREVEIDGVGWHVEVVGSSASPGELGRSIRLLEVRFQAEGGPPLDRTGYVAGVDLDGADVDELQRLGRRLRDGPPAPDPRSGKGRRARSRS